jgi:hypothetical protein
MQQKKLRVIPLLENGSSSDDLYVSLTIYDVPGSLLKEFSQKIIQLHYPGGVSEALKDLMRKAIMEQDLAAT